nr:hypothetical protein BaRGS_021885 [Batillaria attramentaria]
MDHIFGMGGTALCQAIHSGHRHIINALIELGCDVNAPDYDGGLPLSLAIRKHLADVALLLMTVPKCDLSERDPVTKMPPLCAAVMEDMMELVERLVQDPRCQATAGDKDGNSALHLALLEHKYNMITILARCEGFRHLHNKAGLAPVHIVAQLGDFEAFDLLYPPPARKEEAYHHGLGDGDGVIGSASSAALKREIDQQCTYTADTALHLAVREGHMELIDRLLHMGAAVDKQNNSGQTALLTACAQKNSSDVAAIARRLLQAGAPPSVPGALRLQQVTLLATHARESNLTPLHVAASYANLDLVSALCEYGADVNASDERGRSPLYLALVNGAGDVAKFLLEHAGGKVDARTGTRMRGDTLLHVVSQCQRHAGELTNRLILLGCPMDMANANGNLPLHDAISWENVEVVRELLERGANPSVRGGEGSLPLRLAAMTGNVEIAKLLLSAGADINGQEGYDELTEEELEEELSPLQEALQSEMPEFAVFLVEAGCEVPKDIHQYGSGSEEDEQEGATRDSDPDSEDEAFGGEGAKEWAMQTMELRSFLLNQGCNPHSLLQLCLDSVRSCFRSGDPPFAYMAALPLPEKMIDMLFYRAS